MRRNPAPVSALSLPRACTAIYDDTVRVHMSYRHIVPVMKQSLVLCPFRIVLARTSRNIRYCTYLLTSASLKMFQKKAVLLSMRVKTVADQSANIFKIS